MKRVRIASFLGAVAGLLAGSGAAALAGALDLAGQTTVAGDFDGDGVADIATFQPVSGSVRAAPLTALYGFASGASEPETYPLIFAGERSGVAAGDVTGDGRDDLIISDFARGKVSIHSGRGGGARGFETMDVTVGPGPVLAEPWQLESAGGFLAVLAASNAPQVVLGDAAGAITPLGTLAEDAVAGEFASAALPPASGGVSRILIAWQSASDPPRAGGPVPIPYPNFATLYEVESVQGSPSARRAGEFSLRRPSATLVAGHLSGYGVPGHFVGFTADETSLVIYAVSDLFSGPAPGDEIALGFPIGSIASLPSSSRDRLAVTSADGAVIRIYEYTAPGTLTLIDEILSPDPRQPFAGALAAGTDLLIAASVAGDINRPYIIGGLYNGAGGSFEHQFSEPFPTGSLAAAPLTTVALFSGSPFSHAPTTPLETFLVGSWAKNAVFDGSDIHVEVESFGGSGAGLGSSEAHVLVPSSNPARGAVALANQWEPASSLFFGLLTTEADGAAAVAISPPPGSYPSTIEVSFQSGAGVTISSRIDGGPWTTGGAPFHLAHDATVEYFGQHAGGGSSAIKAAVYTIDQPPEIESDGDLIPDAIEALAGSDPFSTDTDGDGADDLDELIAGSGVADPQNAPPDGFSAVPVGAPVDVVLELPPAAGAAAPPLPVVGTRVHELTLQRDLSAIAPVVHEDGTAVSKSHLKTWGDPHAKVVAKPQTRVHAYRNFYFRVDLDTHSNGPGVVSLATIDPPSLPAIIPDLNAADPVADWVAQWQAWDFEAQNPSQTITLGPDAAAAAVFVEAWVGDRLADLGQIPDLSARPIIAAAPPFLAGQRRLTMTHVDAIERPGHDLAAHELTHVVQQMHDAVKNDPDFAPWRETAGDLYRQALEAQIAGAPLPPPLNALRAIVFDEQLPQGYVLQHNQSDLQFLYSRAAGAITPRPTMIVQGTLSYEGGSLILTTPERATFLLVGRNGERFRLPGSGILTAGATAALAAFTGLEQPEGPARLGPTTVEVISLAVASNALTGPVDSDADGLPDPWELAFFGHLEGGFADDSDGDGFADGEEAVAGTDPASALDFPPGEPQLPREITLAFDEATGAAVVEWTGSSTGSYVIETDDDLASPASISGMAPSLVAPNRWRWTQPLPPAGAPIPPIQFFRVGWDY